jgi:hypothetical protein
MKFDCGETREEKINALQQWHRFFCIWPRHVGYKDCRWLETIERKGTLMYHGSEYWEWQYRPIQTTFEPSHGMGRNYRYGRDS